VIFWWVRLQRWLNKGCSGEYGVLETQGLVPFNLALISLANIIAREIVVGFRMASSCRISKLRLEVK